MKVTFIVSAISVVLWSTSVDAIINVGRMPSVVDIGTTYLLNWTATVNYTYNLWLVLDDPYSTAYEWTKVQTLATGLIYQSLNASFPWTAPKNLSANGDYGIWFGAFPIPSNGTNLYTNITNYFRVSNSSLASASASASSIASRTSAPASTATPTGSMAASSAAVTSSAAHNEASSGHSSSLSGGAIAGIVLGILALIAIAVAGILLRRHRKKKHERDQREAAARANRLDPVMKVGQSSFEMQNRGLAKETNV